MAAITTSTIVKDFFSLMQLISICPIRTYGRHRGEVLDIYIYISISVAPAVFMYYIKWAPRNTPFSL